MLKADGCWDSVCKMRELYSLAAGKKGRKVAFLKLCMTSVSRFVPVKS